MPSLTDDTQALVAQLLSIKTDNRIALTPVVTRIAQAIKAQNDRIAAIEARLDEKNTPIHFDLRDHTLTQDLLDQMEAQAIRTAQPPTK